MALLDGGLARLFGAALGGVFRPATLHRVTQLRVRGGSTSEHVALLPCRAQIDAASETMRAAHGRGADATAHEVRILVLAAGLAGPITTDDRIGIDGQLYAITTVGRDPAGAIFDLGARRG
ncbi:MAG: hypothetical protein Q7J32_17255 [Sphingomonadaceae bacterium]|nr:hypothetical protein [Sphingomonadaceae bacterium]